jgi:hypothetical protein
MMTTTTSSKAPEALRRLSGEPQFKVRAKETKDHRRSRTYWRQVSVSADLPLRVSARDVRDRVRALLPAEHRKLSADSFKDWARPDSATRATWGWNLTAERPSLIVSEEEALKLARDVLVPALAQALAAATAAGIEMLRRERAVDQADSLAKGAGRVARNRALDITRYEQRLAALQAELAAEAEVQMAKLLDGDEIDKSVAAHKDTFEPEGVEAGKRLAPRYAVPQHGFMASYPDVTEAEVFGETG